MTEDFLIVILDTGIVGIVLFLEEKLVFIHKHTCAHTYLLHELRLYSGKDQIYPKQSEEASVQANCSGKSPLFLEKQMEKTQPLVTGY